MSKTESRDVEKVLKEHENSGRYIEINGIKTFVLEKGSGEAVICIHGVPTSSFLYRKVVTFLANKGYRAIAVDLPGLGFSERPENYSYDFKNFAHFLIKAIDILGIEKFHLIVHDLGGPIGFALAANNNFRVASLTILNTWIDVVNFEKPLVMRPFEKKILGEAELAMITHATWPVMFSKMGVNNAHQIPAEEQKAYVDLLKKEDNGKAFLKIMRNFPGTNEDRELCYRAVKQVSYPIQAIWGADDPALKYEHYGEEIKEIAGIKEVSLLPSKHFLQEEVYNEIAELVDRQAKMIHKG
ncbi:alpha/beta hydrolase [Antarcticibacterium sp. 1MA-6-2]|uniref:alpha/beta fold hydrolase n=1 Tax=Antarcticibacterium sp. 1MA-6-2 TaxID=2908210 RepID=UPI001F482BB3|nr:alpha/beta hydrolase [Antarcticibacterium sp. 1MA-6-2]UJH91767.1 alpha/beta hydrolase [Antarcticibacterium sp. 1MA-6-2]